MNEMKATKLKTIDDIKSSLDEHNYIANRALATSIYLSLKMDKPIFLEGEPGVGKTEEEIKLAIKKGIKQICKAAHISHVRHTSSPTYPSFSKLVVTSSLLRIA